MVVVRLVEGVADGRFAAARRAEVAELPGLPARPDVRLWVDLDRPAPEELTEVARVFGFHPLAVEDCRAPTHEPKVEAYDGYVFLIVHAIDPASIERRVETTDVECFFAERFLVTHRVRPHPAFEHVAARVDAEPGLLAAGTDRLLHELLDGIVDRYFPALAAMDARADALERALLKASGAGRDLLPRLLALKGEVTHLKRIITPQVEVARKLAGGAMAGVSRHAALYFRDVLDHALRIESEVENLRDELTALMQVHIAVASLRLTEIMRVLTVFAAVFLPLHLVAGIYGMNFEWMPELRRPWGYPFALGLMAAIAAAVLAYFRRRRIM